MKKIITMVALFLIAVGGVNAEDLLLGVDWEASAPTTTGMTYKLAQYAEVGVAFDTPLSLSDYKKVVFTFAKPLSIPAWKSGIKYYGDVSDGAWVASLNTGLTTFELDLTALEITDTQINAITFMNGDTEKQVVTISKITLVKTDNTEVNYTMIEPYTNWGVMKLVSSGEVTFGAKYGVCEVLSATGAAMTHAQTDDVVYQYTITFGSATPIAMLFELNDNSDGFDWNWFASGNTSYTFTVDPSVLTTKGKDCAHIYFKADASEGYPAVVNVTKITRQVITKLTIGSTGWATFSDADNAYNFDGSGVTAYIVTGAESSAITKTAVTNPAANTGLLLTADPGTYSIPVTATGTDYSATNKMVAGTGAEITSSTGSGFNYVLAANASGDAEFQKIAGTSATVPVGKAFLALDADPAGARFLSLDDDGVTAIRDMKVGADSNTYYDVQGRRVLYPKHGLYIMNGKKVILK